MPLSFYPHLAFLFFCRFLFSFSVICLPATVYVLTTIQAIISSFSTPQRTTPSFTFDKKPRPIVQVCLLTFLEPPTYSSQRPSFLLSIAVCRMLFWYIFCLDCSVRILIPSRLKYSSFKAMKFQCSTFNTDTEMVRVDETHTQVLSLTSTYHRFHCPCKASLPRTMNDGP